MKTTSKRLLAHICLLLLLASPALGQETRTILVASDLLPLGGGQSEWNTLYEQTDPYLTAFYEPQGRIAQGEPDPSKFRLYATRWEDGAAVTIWEFFFEYREDGLYLIEQFDNGDYEIYEEAPKLFNTQFWNGSAMTQTGTYRGETNQFLGEATTTGGVDRNPQPVDTFAGTFESTRLVINVETEDPINSRTFSLHIYAYPRIGPVRVVYHPEEGEPQDYRIKTSTYFDNPSIITQPEEQTVNAGETATFTVEADGYGPLSYQWLLDGEPIPDATEATLTIDPAGPQHAGEITVNIKQPGSSVDGTTSEPVTLTVNGELPPYQQWRAGRFTLAELSDDAVSGTTADPDGDEVSNLEEFVAGTDPRRASGRGHIQVVEEGGYFVVTLARQADAADVAVQFESTSDLATWTGIDGEMEILDESPTQLRARWNTPLADSARGVFRLKFVEP